MKVYKRWYEESGHRYRKSMSGREKKLTLVETSMNDDED
jgi:hypothetical protein